MNSMRYQLYTPYSTIRGMNIYRGTPQVGHGLGGLFKVLTKTVLPVARKAAPRLIKSGLRKTAKMVTPTIKTGVKRLVTTKVDKILKPSLKSIGKKTIGKKILSLAKTHSNKIAPKLLKVAKKQAVPALLKAGTGLIGDLTSRKKPTRAIKERAQQVRKEIAKGVSEITSDTLKRKATAALASVAPSAKRSKVKKQITAALRSVTPKVKQVKRKVTFKRSRRKRGSLRQRNYRPAKKLDIWQY